MSEPVEIHVVSDSTGETAARFAEAVERQFPDEDSLSVWGPPLPQELVDNSELG